MPWPEWLVASRTEKGWSQRVLAKEIIKAGGVITQQAVSDWETKKARPGPDQLAVLVRVFDLSPDEIRKLVEMFDPALTISEAEQDQLAKRDRRVQKERRVQGSRRKD